MKDIQKKKDEDSGPFIKAAESSRNDSRFGLISGIQRPSTVLGEESKRQTSSRLDELRMKKK